MVYVSMTISDLVNYLNGKTLSDILCTYNSIPMTSSVVLLEDETIEAIGCNWDLDNEKVIEILRANWDKKCNVKLLSLEGPSGWPEVEISFNTYNDNYKSFSLDWVDE